MSQAKVLLVDIGNRQLKTKLDSDCLSFDWHDDQSLNSFGRYLKNQSFELLVYCCSAPQIESRVLEIVGGYPAQKISTQHIPLVVDSQNTGIDRLLTAFAAYEKSSSAAIVVDVGTAFTIDVVDGHQHFRGGAIGLGLGAQLSALTAAAPHLADPCADSPIIPLSTEAAVYDGTYRALAFGICSLVERYQSTLERPAPVYVCGGDAHNLQSLLPDWQFCDDLLFQGMQLVAEENWL